jgi:hypothetical protein
VSKLKRELLSSVRRGDVTYDTSLSHLRQMSPEAACRQLEEDPTKLWVTLGNIASLFGMTTEELRADLAAGKLVAHFLDNEDGSQSIAVNGEELLRWMVITGRRAIDRS